MSLRSVCIYCLVAMICMNMVTGMLTNIGISDVPLTPLDIPGAQDLLNVTETVEGWAPTEFTFYDFVFGLLNWIGRVGTLITAFPDMLLSFDVPGFIAQPLALLWYFLFFTFIVLALIGGREL